MINKATNGSRKRNGSRVCWGAARSLMRTLAQLLRVSNCYITSSFQCKNLYGQRHNYIEKKSSLRNAPFLTAAGFSIISYSCKKKEKKSSAQFATSSLDSIIHVSCIFWRKPWKTHDRPFALKKSLRNVHKVDNSHASWQIIQQFEISSKSEFCHKSIRVTGQKNFLQSLKVTGWVPGQRWVGMPGTSCASQMCWMTSAHGQVLSVWLRCILDPFKFKEKLQYRTLIHWESQKSFANPYPWQRHRPEREMGPHSMCVQEHQ